MSMRSFEEIYIHGISGVRYPFDNQHVRDMLNNLLNKMTFDFDLEHTIQYLKRINDATRI
jgi:hypothetical protein